MVKKLLNSEILAVVAAVVLIAPISPPAAAAEKKQSSQAQKAAQPEPVCARAAFFEMYKPARLWAKDVLVLSLGSNEVPGIRSEAGKFGMWTAIFVSPSRRIGRAHVSTPVTRPARMPSSAGKR